MICSSLNPRFIGSSSFIHSEVENPSSQRPDSRADGHIQRFGQEQRLRAVAAGKARPAAILPPGTIESESVAVQFSHGLQ
jgi:hypothetical protein